MLAAAVRMKFTVTRRLFSSIEPPLNGEKGLRRSAITDVSAREGLVLDLIIIAVCPEWRKVHQRVTLDAKRLG